MCGVCYVLRTMVHDESVYGGCVCAGVYVCIVCVHISYYVCVFVLSLGHMCRVCVVCHCEFGGNDHVIAV